MGPSQGTRHGELRPTLVPIIEYLGSILFLDHHMGLTRGLCGTQQDTYFDLLFIGRCKSFIQRGLGIYFSLNFLGSPACNTNTIRSFLVLHSSSIHGTSARCREPQPGREKAALRALRASGLSLTAAVRAANVQFNIAISPPGGRPRSRSVWKSTRSPQAKPKSGRPHSLTVREAS